jgi:hypothetical protein
MRFRRCPYWFLTALWVAALGMGGQALFAQNKLPPNILSPQAQLTAQEQGVVNTFLDVQVARLQSDDPAEVSKGRARIAEQFNLSTSDYFLNYYRQSLANRVTPLVQPGGPLMTRLNVAILSAKLTGDNLVAVLQACASDPSPAVRYWIAKAVGAAAKKSAFNTQQQQDVLTVLADRLKIEDSSLVLEQVMLAIAEIDLPQATITVLVGLDSRIAFHQNNPTARYKPVLGGMQQLWTKLIEQRSDGKNVNKEQIELARIAFRYYSLVADQLAAFVEGDDKEADEDLKQDKASMALNCGRVMDDIVSKVAQLTPPQPVDTKNAAELKVSTDRWRDLLKGAPFNITDEQPKAGE